MATITKIKPGQTLYDVKANSGIQRWNGKYSVWPVIVEEVNIEGGYIIARWNVVNPARKMWIGEIKKLRVNPPDEK